MDTAMTPLQQERHRRDQWVVRRELARQHRRRLRECLDRWVNWEKDRDQEQDATGPRD